MLSRGQSRFFDCNKLPVLSVTSGAAMLLLLYGMAESVYFVARSADSQQVKVRAAMRVLVLRGTFVVVAGFLVLMSHICP